MLVPVKAFRQAKVRLAPALPAPERAGLAREMARRVLAAAAPLPVAVVCDDAEVAAWAESQGATVIWGPERGLNAAVAAGVARLAAEGVLHVTISHADLPLATDLASVGQAGRGGRLVTLVPDRRADGTNVLCVPTGAGFRFAYGPGSARRHCDEAIRLGFGVEVLRRPDLAWDVDLPDDLTGLPVITGAPASLARAPDAPTATRTATR